MVPSQNKPVILAICGMLLITLGTLLCIFWPILIHHWINKELVLTPTSTSFDIWKDTRQIPLYMKVHFFNWTNPEELKIPGKKPALEQLGPYTFRETREKVNIVFHPKNNTVSYDMRRTWHFDESKSNGSLSDNITQLNAVALSAVHKVRYWPYFLQFSMSAVAFSEINDLHVTKTVDELLFTGYSDPLIDMGQLTGHMIDLPPFDKFGWFYKRNGTTDFDGHFNMATGGNDLSNLGAIQKWNYRNNIEFFGQSCDALVGSAGEFWPPERKKDEIAIFSADICRPLIYEYAGVSTHQGIDGYKYAMGDKTLSNSTKMRYPHEEAKYFETTKEFVDIEHSRNIFEAPEDYAKVEDVVNVGQCYCDGECTPSGLINVTACRYGAPAFVSLPHFHKADPIYRQQVNGMNPRDEEHSFSITLEPTTGIPINVAARIQINLLLQPSESISLFKNVPRIFFPVVWIDQEVVITEHLASSLRLLLQLPWIGFYSSIGMVCLGLLIIVIAGILRCLNKRRNLTARNLNGQRTGILPPNQKSELIYLDTTLPNDDNHSRCDRQLYPKLESIGKQNC